MQKRFSHGSEDVATEALEYILGESEAACNGFNKLLRGIEPDLPPLSFRTQLMDGSIRPDMWGYVGSQARVFTENKFWAGLTDNQPVSYLRHLAEIQESAVLLVIAPSARVEALWRELGRRIQKACISTSERPTAPGVQYSLDTGIGPVLALTSWTTLLSTLEHECVEDVRARGDLSQLRGLCDAADSEAFSSVSLEEMTDQRIPDLILQLSVVMQEIVEQAVSRGVLNLKGTMPQASAERIGRYSNLEVSNEAQQRIGPWLGVHFRLWKRHGTTPLWAVFHATDFGQARLVRATLEPWASRAGILATTDDDGSFVVALDFPAHEEKSRVVDALVKRLGEIWRCLSEEKSQSTGL